MKSYSKLFSLQVTRLGLALMTIALIAWIIVPLTWTFLASLKTPVDVYDPSIIPLRPTLSAYGRVLDWPNFWTYGFNSLWLATASTFITVSVSCLAGYGFARYAFKWRHFLLLLIVVPRLVPTVALLAPLFELLDGINMLDNRLGIMLLYAAMSVPFATWLLSGFIAAVPLQLEEAAWTEGASRLRAFVRVLLPIAMPGLLMAGVLSFVLAWNEFPFILAFTFSAESRTLPYQLFLLRDSLGIVDWPLINAFTIVTVLPLIALYLRFEKYVVAGLVQGAVK